MSYTLKSVDADIADFTAYGGALEFLYNHDPEVVIHGPAETGKTLAACWKVHILASKYPGAQLAIVRKTQKSVYGSVLQTFEKVIAGAPIVPYGGRKPERYEYPNGSIVWIGGMDNADKVLSTERDFIYVNQAEELALDDWEKLATRATGRGAVIPYPQLVGDANPAGSMHWMRKRADAGSLTFIQSRHTDNPTLFDPDTGEITVQGVKSMAALERLTGVRKKRLLHGIWATAEGAVYDMFDVAIHRKVREPSEFKLWYLAIDEGYTNPAVVLLVGEDADGRLHVAKEFYKTGQLISKVIAQCLDWYYDKIYLFEDDGTPKVDDDGVHIFELERKCEIIIVDSAAAGLIAELRNNDMNTQGAKGRVKDGIDLVQDCLAVQGDGLPRLTFDPSCVSSINDFESYIYKKDKDEPQKLDDHAPDAIRYLIFYLAKTGSVQTVPNPFYE